MITDRDIANRVVAQGKDPKYTTAKDIITKPVITADKNDTIKDVIRTMEAHKIRRLPIIDKNGEICGIVSQADLARNVSNQAVGSMVQKVSKPTKNSSKVGNV